MDRASATARINKGYARLASKLGSEFDRYRPVNGIEPLALSNFEGSQRALFDPDPKFSMTKPPKAGQAVWYGAFDASDVLRGDFFVSEDGETFFVGVIPFGPPPECVACNMRVSIFRPTASKDADGYYYGGNTANAGQGQLLARDWPCSFLQGTKGDKAALNLPNDTRSPWFNVLLPEVPGIVLQSTDQFFDQHGRRYVISSPELTAHGYRLTAGQSEA